MQKIIVPFLLLFAVPLWAAPAITNVTWTGNLLEGTTITITLSGGGTKPNGHIKPNIFANFEQGAGTPSNSNNSLTLTNMQYTAVGANCFGGTGCIESSTGWESANATTADCVYESAGNGGKKYFTTKHWSDATKFVSQTFGDHGGVIQYYYNWKMFRDWTGAGFSQPNYYIAQQLDGSIDLQIENNEGTVQTGYDHFYFTPVVPFPRNQWDQYEFIEQMPTSPGADNGKLILKLNGVTVLNSSTVRFNTAGTTGIESHLFWQYDYTVGGCGNCPSNLSQYAPIHFRQDELYLDTSWCRVMFSTSSTESTPGYKSPSPAIAWANTSIQTVFNKSNFTNGQTVYMYVYDSNNAVNAAGYAVAVNGTSSGAGGGGGGADPGNSPTVTPTQQNPCPCRKVL